MDVRSERIIDTFRRIESKDRALSGWTCVTVGAMGAAAETIPG